MFYHDVAALLKNAKYAVVIHVKINPEFNIYLDQDENVVALECLNADAKDAYGKKSFAGKSLDETLQTKMDSVVTEAAKEQDITVTTAMDMSEEVRMAQKEAGLIKQACSNCNGTGDCPDCPVCGGSFKCVVCGGSGTL